MTGPAELERFVAAQDGGGVYETALSELRAGRKRSHWMWFVFPQIAGLGQSSMSKIYAIRTLAEASAYLEHPILGPRLAACARVLLELDGATALEIFGAIDALKLRSSMTLFARAAPESPVFGQVLAQYFDGVPDAATEALLASATRSARTRGFDE
jgi:uncharacterized protein (DUF1810 family)